MLGKNHALYAGTIWMGAYPLIAEPLGIVDYTDVTVLAATTVIAAGAGVLPDLDHPDARPSRHFGILSKMLAKGINSASGGHRVGTHTLMCAALMGLLTWVVTRVPEPYNMIAAAIACGFCASVGLALVGPSMGFRMSPVADVVIGLGTGAWTWFQFDRISSALWAIAAGGVLVHILCDAVTKGGVPFFMPFTRKRFALGLFRVGGIGESIASIVGFLGLGAACYYVVISI